VHFHAASRRADQVLDDDRVLEALVLDEQLVPRLVMIGRCDPARVRGTRPGRSCRALKVWRCSRLEALDDLAHVMAARRDDRIVTRLGQIPRRPVERIDERRHVVHTIDFSCVRAKAGWRLVRRCPLVRRRAGGFVLLLAAAPAGLSNHANRHTRRCAR